jgi:hypothetical protein
MAREHIITEATYDEEDGSRLTPIVVRCFCRRRLELWDSWANTCDCGREWNGSGQALAPRSEWGWETGETF